MNRDPIEFMPKMSSHPPPADPFFDNASASYPVVAMGGTFDHLHLGHKILLSMAALLASEKLIVGMTGR
jgi:pantetheine-phosphate adenylyltransferase